MTKEEIMSMLYEEEQDNQFVDEFVYDNYVKPILDHNQMLENSEHDGTFDWFGFFLRAVGDLAH